MITSRRPNFFIVGAPKCGTTALSEYLRGHPNIFMSTPKEPHYFSTDFNPLVYHYVRTLEDYLDLFRDASEEHHRMGEASVFYLYSTTAIANIREFDQEARIIAMVRNPIDMAYSLHAQYCYSLHENIMDFATAWQLQAARREGKKLPPSIDVPAYLQYQAVCSLGQQIERLLEVFPRHQVQVIVFDDLVFKTKAVYEDTLAFLGVPSDGREDFPIVNPSVELSSPTLKRIDGYLRRAARFRHLNRTVLATKRALGLEGRRLLGISSGLYTKQSERPALDPTIRAELAGVFEPDVDKLGRLLGIDLEHWLGVE
jgi:hypothetical protein